MIRALFEFVVANGTMCVAIAGNKFTTFAAFCIFYKWLQHLKVVRRNTERTLILLIQKNLSV